MRTTPWQCVTTVSEMLQACIAVSGSSSAEEGCTDDNANCEALLLRKAAQTPIPTGNF